MKSYAFSCVHIKEKSVSSVHDRMIIHELSLSFAYFLSPKLSGAHVTQLYHAAIVLPCGNGDMCTNFLGATCQLGCRPINIVCVLHLRGR